jgi:hypothetical protein
MPGPVWHASVAPVRGFPIRTDLERQAEKELEGVGDVRLGEWREWSGKAFHIRRRLSAAEQEAVGPVMDIRRTPEALMRAARLGPLLRLAPGEVLEEELGTVPS